MMRLIIGAGCPHDGRTMAVTGRREAILTRTLVRFATWGLLALAVSLTLTPREARAAMQFQLVITEDGTSYTSGVVNWAGMKNPITKEAEINLPTIQVGDFDIYMTVSATNSPGNGQYAHLGIGSTYIVNNNYSSAGTHTLTIAVTATGFSSPGTDGNASLPYLTLDSNASGNLFSDGRSTSASGTFTAYASASNNPFATGDFSAPPVAFSLGDSTTSYSGQSSQKPFVGSLYSMTLVGQYTLSEGAILSNGSGNAFMHAPEPSTLALGAFGVPALALGRWVRRRRSSGQTPRA